jgi:hypothetical protein
MTGSGSNNGFNAFIINGSLTGTGWGNFYNTGTSPNDYIQLYNTFYQEQTSNTLILHYYNNILNIIVFNPNFRSYQLSNENFPKSAVYNYKSNNYLLYDSKNTKMINSEPMSNVTTTTYVFSNFNSSVYQTISLPVTVDYIQYSSYHRKLFAISGSSLYLSDNSYTWSSNIIADVNPASPFLLESNIGEFYINQYTSNEVNLPAFIFPSFNSTNIYYTYDSNIITGISNIQYISLPTSNIRGVKLFQQNNIVVYSGTNNSGFTFYLNSNNFYQSISPLYPILRTTIALTTLAVNPNNNVPLRPLSASYQLQAIP